MSRHRFFIPPDRWNAEDLRLEGEEAHHCTQVVRCRPGDRVTVFDGSGTEANVEIVTTTDQLVTLRPLGMSRSVPLRSQLILGQAVPKGKNMDLIAQKAAELGASALMPLLSDRTVVRLDADEAGKRRDKWQRNALEACKQCGRNLVPDIAVPQTVTKALGALGRPGPGELRLIAAISPETLPLRELLAEHRENHGGDSPQKVHIWIGPEGDFTPAELSQALTAGFRPLSLGPIVLRSETAALYALSVLGYELL